MVSVLSKHKDFLNCVCARACAHSLIIFVCAAFVGDMAFTIKIQRLVETQMSASNRQVLARNLFDALLPKTVQAVSSAYGS